MRAAIYARVSTEKQEKQETIRSQVKALREYARRSNIAVHDEYLDNGYSGELYDRPDLDRLMEDAKKGLFDAALIHSPDRLSRDFVNMGLLKRDLSKRGVRVLFLNRPDSKDSDEDLLTERILGSIAEYEKSQILKRTRRGREHKAENDIIVGHSAPYGYRYVKGDTNRREPGRYEVVDDEARVVRLIFDLLVKDRISVRGIAKELTRRGIPPPRGKHWRTSSLYRTLKNETYIGTTHYNKRRAIEPGHPRNVDKYRRHSKTSHTLRPKEEWIPIHLPKELWVIDPKVFKQAQRQLETNSDQSPRNTRHHYLLRGLVKCGVCGSPYAGVAYHKRLYYRCNNRQQTFPLPRECTVGSTRAEPLETAVWDKLSEALMNPGIITKQIEKLRAKGRGGIGQLERDLREIDRGVEAVSNKENRLLDAYEAGSISVEQLNTRMDKLRNSRKRLEGEKCEVLSRIEACQSDSFKKRPVEKACKSIAKGLANLKNDFEGRRQLLSLLVNEIILKDKEVRIRGVVPVECLPTSSPSASFAFQPSGCCGHRRDTRVSRPARQSPGKS